MKHCCCCDLRTGGLIIGTLEIIGGIIGIIISSAFLNIWGAAREEINKIDFEKLKKIITEDEGHNGLHLQTVIDEETFHAAAQHGITIFTLITAVFLVMSVFQVIISAFLIHGIRKKSCSLLSVWMVLKVIFVVLLAVMSILSFFNSITIGEIIFYLVLFGISAFYLNTIHSLREKIKLETNELYGYLHPQNKL